jgi:DNA-binding SARP family transcriptional activator
MVKPVVARVCVLGRFAFGGPDGPLQVSQVGQRLIAALALNGGSVQRHRLKRMLWPGSIERRADANLRSTTWRLPALIRSCLIVERSMLALPPSWALDVAEARQAAEGIRVHGLTDVDTNCLVDDVLPGWNDDWLFVLRESHRQLRLHALEELAEHLLQADRPLEAVDVAMRALESEPLRESAQQLVLRAHIAAGHRGEARRLFRQFAEMLRSELSVAPTSEMCKLLDQSSETVTSS